MNLDELKKQFVREEFKIGENEYGNIFSFIDFGNVNNWLSEDRQDADRKPLFDDQKLSIDIKKLKNFVDIFSDDSRFYYGHDPENAGSLGFIRKARDFFGKSRVFTKPIQKVRHYLSDSELFTNTRNIYNDKNGAFIFIPKCNFDVEISVDAIKLADYYDTFCLLSGDADFVHLIRFLKSRGKKIILIKGGYVVYQLKEIVDVIINAQDIKKHIAVIKQKPGN